MQIATVHQIGMACTERAATRAFYEELLGLRLIAEFDPPGLMFFDVGGIRLLFESGNTPATVYLRVDDIDAAHAELVARGIAFQEAPACIFADAAGQFGTAGEEEWMAFFQDPSGNQLALAARRTPSGASVDAD